MTRRNKCNSSGTTGSRQMGRRGGCFTLNIPLDLPVAHLRMCSIDHFVCCLEVFQLYSRYMYNYKISNDNRAVKYRSQAGIRHHMQAYVELA